MIVLEMTRGYRIKYARIRETIGLGMGKVVGVRVGYGKSREITLMVLENVARIGVVYGKTRKSKDRIQEQSRYGTEQCVGKVVIVQAWVCGKLRKYRVG